ncbi:MAG: hypothetical protein JJU10_11750 [Idiomarina sp.]|nr:hypothetical protein [Idiomarina sp.]
MAQWIKAISQGPFNRTYETAHMKQLDTAPEHWLRKFSILSPITGQCHPLNHISSATLQLGAWGVGVALYPGNQKISLSPGWECHHYSPDRRDWQLTGRVQGVVLRAHLRIWAESDTLPLAHLSDEKQTLLTLSPNVFKGAGSCAISLTVPQHGRLCWLPVYGRMTAGESSVMEIYALDDSRDE